MAQMYREALGNPFVVEVVVTLPDLPASPHKTLHARQLGLQHLRQSSLQLPPILPVFIQVGLIRSKANHHRQRLRHPLAHNLRRRISHLLVLVVEVVQPVQALGQVLPPHLVNHPQDQRLLLIAVSHATLPISTVICNKLQTLLSNVLTVDQAFVVEVVGTRTSLARRVLIHKQCHHLPAALIYFHVIHQI